MSDQPPTATPNATEGGITGKHPDETPFEFLAAPATGNERNTARLRVIPIACWRVNDVRFAFDSAFVTPDVSVELQTLISLREAHKMDNPAGGNPQYPSLSVFGHADPVGPDDYNKGLSGRRATAIYALLVSKTEPAKACALWQQIASAENWGAYQRQTMQETTGLPAGTSDSALIQSYLNALCPDELQLTSQDFLAQGSDAKGKGDYQGCSSFNPLLIFSQAQEAEFQKAGNDQAIREKRNTANAPNRRVLVLLFRPGSKIEANKWPCPRATEGVSGCHLRFWSDGQNRRSQSLPDKERRFEETQDTFACRFYQRLTNQSPCEKVLRLDGSHISVLLRSNSGAVPLAQLEYSIAIDDGQTLTGKTDDDGLIQHDDVPPGDYPLTLDGKQVDLLVPTLPKYLEKRLTRVPNFYLFDDDAGGTSSSIDGYEDLRAQGGESLHSLVVS